MTMPSPAEKLRALLKAPGLLLMPCCFDALSAKLIAQAGFPLTFMSGFAVSATRLGLPDTGLISYGEMVEQGRAICASVAIPVIGDADTGYGNAMNVQRTVSGYAQAGFAGIMIEDQLWPKRCGHVGGKQVVDRHEAVQRIKAAADCRASGHDILIMARTDARATHGLDEAIARALAFADAGADITFVEAPQSVEELARIGREVPGSTMANMLEHGRTPILPPNELAAMGFKIAAYPLTLLSAAVKAMQTALTAVAKGEKADGINFAELQEVIGFPRYLAAEKRYQ